MTPDADRPRGGSPEADQTSKLAGGYVGSDSTTDPRRDRGAVIVLVDPAGVAEQVIEKRGDAYAARLALELLGPLRAVRPAVVAALWRVSFSADWWKASTASKSRSFARAGDARRFATRMYGEGYNVTVHRAQRTAWTELDFDRFLDGEEVRA